jgi:hypothetical protein
MPPARRALLRSIGKATDISFGWGNRGRRGLQEVSIRAGRSRLGSIKDQACLGRWDEMVRRPAKGAAGARLATFDV